MRRTALFGLSVFLLSAGFLASAPSVFAATDATDLYVNNLNSSCANTGSGTEAAPFCTIQAAANVVEPGQTVHVIDAGDGNSVRITRSGTAAQPITFVAQATAPETVPSVYSPGFFVNGAWGNNDNGITVTDSPGTNVTSNTVGSNCGSGVLVSYHSTGATIENNIRTWAAATT